MPGIASIAVLRPNDLGDFVFALPALGALRDTWPKARILFLGKAWHLAFLPGRGIVDEVLEVPPVPGITIGQSYPHDENEVEAFCEGVRERRLDLALQLFGGGRYSNPFLRRLGAGLTVGFRAAGTPALDRPLAYQPLQNERLRLLEAVALAGAHTTELDPRLPVLERDRRELGDIPLPKAPLAVLQPGARDARRRWPAQRFAAVGDALAQAGAAVAIHGSREERELTAEVAGAMRLPALDLGGRLTLGGLAALLDRAQLLVSNDTGPLHLAHAVGTPTVGIYWLTNLLVSGPLFGARHRALLAVRTECPECRMENIETRCAHDASFVEEISVEEVKQAALELWRLNQAAPSPAPALPP